MSIIIVIVKGNSNFYHILNLFTPQPCRYVNEIKIICYLHLFMPIKYNLFLAAFFIYLT